MASLKKLLKSKLKKAIPAGFYVFYADLDNAGSKVEQASARDDIPTIKDVSARINQALEIFEKATRKAGGEPFIEGGDDFAALMPIGTEDLLQKLRVLISKEIHFTVTIGYGPTSAKATTALVWGKTHGKDQVVEWTEKIQEDVHNLALIPEEQKIKEAFSKAHYKVPEKYHAELIIMTEERDKVLLGIRTRDGKLNVPGGAYALGDMSPLDTMVREVYEETTMDVSKMDTIEMPVATAKDGEKFYSWGLVIPESKRLDPHRDPYGEIVSWFWVPVGDLENMWEKIKHHEVMHQVMLDAIMKMRSMKKDQEVRKVKKEPLLNRV